MLRSRSPVSVGLLIIALGAAHPALAKDQEAFIFWDTVSPDGQYALAWTAKSPVSTDDLPNPDEDKGVVQNWLMKVDSRKPVLLVPHSFFWRLPDGTHPEHYNLETIWSDDSAILITLVNFEWPTGYSTGPAFILGTKPLWVSDLLGPLTKTFGRVLVQAAGQAYRKQNSDFYFAVPWFLGPDQFELFAEASHGPIRVEPDVGYFGYRLTFSFRPGSNGIVLERAKKMPESEESADRQLNRAYRALIGLLQPADREALKKEERAWIAQYDAAKSSEAKEALRKARIEDLQNHSETLVNELNVGQKQPGGG
jgi:hypothetical protein